MRPANVSRGLALDGYPSQHSYVFAYLTLPAACEVAVGSSPTYRRNELLVSHALDLQGRPASESTLSLAGPCCHFPRIQRASGTILEEFPAVTTAGLQVSGQTSPG